LPASLQGGQIVTQDQLSIFFFAALVPMSLVVFGRMLMRIRERGGRVNAQEFGIPDLFMGFFLVGFFSLAVLGSSGTAEPGDVARTLTAKNVAENVIGSLLLLGIVIGFLTVRRLSPVKLFGLRQMPVWRAVLVAVLLIAAIFPILLFVTLLTQLAMSGQVHEQEVVTFFRNAAGSNQTSSVIALYVMAVIVAPIMEETMFRGYLYGVFKGWAGALPSAIFTATLFAAVHNSLSVFPSLLFLALALTVAYEWSGSLLLPMAMHATFNATQLGFLLMATVHGPHTP
jgi:membrane protease YdiL (CAAX protease family)